MVEAFVIAFIHCASQGCLITYPRPDLVFAARGQCEAQLPGVAAEKPKAEAADAACLAVPGAYLADEWIAGQATNLRKGPSAAADIIGTVPRGTRFRVMASRGKWLWVETADRKVGFLWSDRARPMQVE
jgi:Bacterial SH3 domain